MNATLIKLLDEGIKTGFTTVEAFGETIEKNRYECFPNEPASFHSIKTGKVTTRAFWDSGAPVGFCLSKPGEHSIKSAFFNIYSTHLPDKKENYRLRLPAPAAFWAASLPLSAP